MAFRLTLCLTIHMPETPPSPEKHELRAHALELWRARPELKVQPGGDPAQEAYDAWIDRERQDAQASGDWELGDLLVDIEIARFHRQAGFNEYAKIAFDEAISKAEQIGRRDLAQQLTGEMYGWT